MIGCVDKRGSRASRWFCWFELKASQKKKKKMLAIICVRMKSTADADVLTAHRTRTYEYLYLLRRYTICRLTYGVVESCKSRDKRRVPECTTTTVQPRLVSLLYVADNGLHVVLFRWTTARGRDRGRLRRKLQTTWLMEPWNRRRRKVPIATEVS